MKHSPAGKTNAQANSDTDYLVYAFVNYFTRPEGKICSTKGWSGISSKEMLQWRSRWLRVAIMEVRYYRDPDTDLPHIYGHGVTEAEVEWILANPSEDESSANDSRQALGQTADGRYLRVIYVPDEEGDGVFVVTAYPLSGKQLKAFKRRKRRRGWRTNNSFPRVGMSNASRNSSANWMREQMKSGSRQMRPLPLKAQTKLS
jgi:hypothetical protein